MDEMRPNWGILRKILAGGVELILRKMLLINEDLLEHALTEAAFMQQRKQELLATRTRFHLALTTCGRRERMGGLRAEERKVLVRLGVSLCGL
jgi:hypothetical protein